MKVKLKSLHRFSVHERGASVGGVGVSVPGLENSKSGLGNTNRRAGAKDIVKKTCEGFLVLHSHCFAMEIIGKYPLCEAVKAFFGP